MHFTSLSPSGSGSQVLHKGTDSVGHVFCALPRPKQLRQPAAWQAHCPRWAMCLNLPSPHHLFPGCAAHHLRCAVCLLWGADLRLWLSWQMSTFQDPRKTLLQLEACSQFGGGCWSPGLKLPLTFQFWLSHACLSASREGRGLYAAH